MVQTISGVKQNLWRRQGSGLYAPSRRNFPIDNLALYLPLWEPSQASLLNGTGIATEAPLALVGPAAQTFNVTQAGTFKIYLQVGQTGTATAGTMAVTGSPVALVGGLNTITTTGATGNFTVAVPTIISKDLNAHVATVTGAIWGSQGRILDGDDYISSPRINNLWAVGATVHIWLSPTDWQPADTQYLWGGRTGVQRMNAYLNTNGTISWQCAKDANNYRYSALDAAVSGDGTSTWKLLSFVLAADLSSVDIYINGTLPAQTKSSLGTVTAAGLVAADLETPHFGALSLNGTPLASYMLVGKVGEYQIVQRPGTVGEIMRYYLATKWRYS